MCKEIVEKHLHLVLCASLSGLHAVFSGVSPVLVSSIGEDLPPLAGVGLCRHFCWHPGLLCTWDLLRFLL